MSFPPATEFVGMELLSTFGKTEAECMAKQIIEYCADAGTWDVSLFQLERLAGLADFAESRILNGGIENHVYARGLQLLKPKYVDANGLRARFVEQLIECRSAWKPGHPITNRLHRAVVKRAK